MHATLSKGIVRRYGDAIDTLENVLYWFFADVKYPRPFLLSGQRTSSLHFPCPLLTGLSADQLERVIDFAGMAAFHVRNAARREFADLILEFVR
jgi:hypothetical protein